jgi:hypothetical protein
MQNGILTADWESVADAVIMAIIFAVLGAAVSIVTAPNFDVLSLDGLSPPITCSILRSLPQSLLSAKTSYRPTAAASWA